MINNIHAILHRLSQLRKPNTLIHFIQIHQMKQKLINSPLLEVYHQLQHKAINHTYKIETHKGQ